MGTQKKKKLSSGRTRKGVFEKTALELGLTRQIRFPRLEISWQGVVCIGIASAKAWKGRNAAGTDGGGKSF